MRFAFNLEYLPSLYGMSVFNAIDLYRRLRWVVGNVTNHSFSLGRWGSLSCHGIKTKLTFTISFNGIRLRSIRSPSQAGATLSSKSASSPTQETVPLYRSATPP